MSIDKDASSDKFIEDNEKGRPDHAELQEPAQTILREQLKALIIDMANNHTLDERDRHLLFLRLGLANERYSTLVETGKILCMSSENVRRRQNLILRRKIRDPFFFQTLAAYGQLARLPRGILEKSL